MHVLATALFDRPAFSTCVSHGIVLGDDGRKMSKSLSNYPDPHEMFDVYGADAMRWYLLSSPILRGADFSVTEIGDPRHGPPRDPAVLERLLLPDAVRQCCRSARHVPDRSDRCARPLPARRAAGSWSTVRHRSDGCLRPVRCLRVRRLVPRHAHQLVHPAQPRPVLGGRSGRDRHPAHGAGHAVPGRRAVAAARHRSRPRRPHRWSDSDRDSVHLTDWPSAERVPVRRRAARRHGTGARRLLDTAVVAQGRGSAGAATARRVPSSPRPMPACWLLTSTSCATS